MSEAFIIRRGLTPTGTINITGNGIVDVTNYSTANVEVEGNSGGVSPVEESSKDINFYDYDGTRLYSYLLSDLPLAALPNAPDHSEDDVPLTFQEWTHTLEQVNACTTKLDVGATLIPTDGKTHLIINIATEGRMTVPLYFAQTDANGVSIDWGDGSIAQTVAGTGYVSTTHTYASIGQYDITLTARSGCTITMGSNGNWSSTFGPWETNACYLSMLKKVYIGNGVASLYNNAFKYCYSLASVVIPSSVTSIGSYCFYGCYALTCAIIPQSVTRISSKMFGLCIALALVVIPFSVTSIDGEAFVKGYALASIIIPDSVMSIGNYCFQYCMALTSLMLPQGLTCIGSYVFQGCSILTLVIIPQSVVSIYMYALSGCKSMACYDFTACTAVPTLSNSNAFSDIPSDCIMKIPSALFSEWSTATNWSTYASKMVAV